MSYAQTNIQLYNQLRLAGWNDNDLRQVHAAYELAMSVCGGLYRPNHKPFLAHLVGTASILAAEGAGSTIVAAGMLHSVYGHGEFGDGSRGIHESKRRQVRRSVGAACEALVARYASFSWRLEDLETFIAASDRLSPIDQVAALIKLADTLEDHLDHGMQYSPHKSLPAGEGNESAWCAAVVQMAVVLRHRSLASALEATIRFNNEAVIADFLRAAQASSFVVVPDSHRMRTSVRLSRAYRRLRARLDRARQDRSKKAA